MKINKCFAQNGAGIVGNAGGIYMDLNFATLCSFVIKDALIQECKAINNTSLSSASLSGYGGGIFISGQGDYTPDSNGLDFKGLKILDNEADNAGQSMYVVMNKVKEWCRQGIKGEYAKGNYSEEDSDERDLEGFPQNINQFNQIPQAQILRRQRPLECYWFMTYGGIWHVLQSPLQSREDIQFCGEFDEPCKTIQFALIQISLRKGGSETAFVDEKKIGISEGGFDLLLPVKFSPDISYTDNVKIMKQLYGTSQLMTGLGQLQILKEEDDSKEISEQGWLQTSGGIRLSLYEINIKSDQSLLKIPLIFIEGQSSSLEFQQITISEFDFSPQTSAQGLIHMITDDSQMFISQCIFSDIEIIGIGGNLFRFESNTQPTLSSVIATITECQFTDINTQGDNEQRGGSAIYAEIGDQGQLSIIGPSEFINCVCNGGNAGAIFAQLDSTGLLIIDGSVLFKECNTIINSEKGGRGGSLYLDFTEESTYNFTIGYQVSFIDNKADLFGRDIFIYCWNLVTLDFFHHILFDVSNPYNQINALYGTEYEPISDTHTKQLIDYNLLSLYDPYFSDTILLSTSQLGRDSLTCGRINDPCYSFTYSQTKLETPEWISSTVPIESESFNKVVHKFIAIQQMVINEQFQTESDVVTIRGAFSHEIDEGINRAKVIFRNNGQIICSDLAQWQISNESENKGVNQQLTLQYLNFIIPEIHEGKSIIKLIGSEENKKLGRNIELKIDDCLISMDDSTLSAVSTYFLEANPFMTNRIHISLINTKAESISLIGKALIDIKYESEIILFENSLTIEKCLFKDIQSTFSSSSLQEITVDSLISIPLTVASVINIHGSSAIILPIYISDSSFENCSCVLIVDSLEKRHICVGGALIFSGRNLHLTFEHIIFKDCSGSIEYLPSSSLQSNFEQKYTINSKVAKSSLHTNNSSLSQTQQQQHSTSSSFNSDKKPKNQLEIGGSVFIGLIYNSVEQIFIQKRRIAEYLREQGDITEDIFRIIDPLSKPQVIFDICIFRDCKTIISGSNVEINVLESGGVIFHTEKSAARLNLHSSIFQGCSTSTSSSLSTNIAPSDQILAEQMKFEPLLEREIRIGTDGSGLIIVYRGSAPNINADGIQFKDFNRNYLTIQLHSGRFTSQTIKLQGGQKLTLKGEGENFTQILQKDSMHSLIVIKDSQLYTSNITTELNNAVVALIRAEGNGMSVITGLRVSGSNQISSTGSVFEMISGELNLIDIQIRDIIMIRNLYEKNMNNEMKKQLNGLIVMKESAKLLLIDKFSIANMSFEEFIGNEIHNMVLMNSGKNARMIVRNGIFLQDSYPTDGSAIRIEPLTEDQKVEVEGVLFKGLTADLLLDNKGGAVYIDMRNYDVEISFKRCIFVGNTADYGSNIFVAYANPSQRIERNSFIGCTAVVGNSHESDISVCYSVGDNDNEIFIDERDLIHSSWNRQKSEGIVRFISNSEVDHPFNPNIESGSITNPCDSYTSLISYLALEPDSIDGSTGRAEIIIFGEGQFISPFIDLIQARSSIVNIVGCGKETTQIIASQIITQSFLIQGGDGQSLVIERLSFQLSADSPSIGFVDINGADTGLVIQEVTVKGYSGSTPQNTILNPSSLFKIEGFAYMRDVIIENVHLQTGQILLVDGMKRLNDQQEMEQLGNKQPGFYGCIFDDITSNDTSLIQFIETSIQTSSTKNLKSIFISNEDHSTKFIIDDIIFSKCKISLDIKTTESNGGLIDAITKYVEIQILNSEFRNIEMHSRNMIYIGWNEEQIGIDYKIMNIADTLFTNCFAIIPGMEVQQQVQEPISSSNELYSDGDTIYDIVDNHGLIYTEKINIGIDIEIRSGLIDISNMFVAGCHSAVGSSLSVTGLTFKLQESVFIQPMCFSNIIYLNQSHASIIDCYFKGYNGTISNPYLLKQTEQQQNDNYNLCPNNPQFYSTISFALIYGLNGKYEFENDVFEYTRMDAIKIENSKATVKNVTFNNPTPEDESDESEFMIICIGDSEIQIIDPNVDNQTYEDCIASGHTENECKFKVIYDNQCQIEMSDGWTISELPIPFLSKAVVVVNTSNKESIKFSLEGDQMIQEFFTVKIIQLRDKTEEEIKQEQEDNKELWEKYHPQQINSQSHSISKNEEELPRDEDGFIIWPVEGHTQVPFTVNADIQQRNKATFIMKDYSWLDSRKSWYGVLISNDGTIFSGKQGLESEPVQLEIIVEEGEQFLNFEKIVEQDISEIGDESQQEELIPQIQGKNRFPLWAILLIVLIPIIITIIIIIICCCCFYYKKKKVINEQRNTFIERKDEEKYVTPLDRVIQQGRESVYQIPSTQASSSSNTMTPPTTNPNILTRPVSSRPQSQSSQQSSFDLYTPTLSEQHSPTRSNRGTPYSQRQTNSQSRQHRFSRQSSNSDENDRSIRMHQVQQPIPQSPTRRWPRQRSPSISSIQSSSSSSQSPSTQHTRASRRSKRN
ncbi:MAG: hypothetical protein EZS28_003348 [Streblomastix strix]|uniref:Uncharacterized protein n=1 Tax=Streblomastix strix TaxID=222440 RepID=A0A5J4X1D7_9EUKA|nr:MAG: hypothetical protein EZS28_003348 [Streblomastix strix]